MIVDIDAIEHDIRDKKSETRNIAELIAALIKTQSQLLHIVHVCDDLTNRVLSLEAKVVRKTKTKARKTPTVA
jgi:hypothetical protein